MKLFTPAAPGSLAIVASLLAWTTTPASAAHRGEPSIFTLSIDVGEPEELVGWGGGSVSPVSITLATMMPPVDFASCRSVLEMGDCKEVRSLKMMDQDALVTLYEQRYEESSTLLALIQLLAH